MGITMPNEKPGEQWDLNRYLKSMGLTEADVETSAKTIKERLGATVPNRKPVEEPIQTWDPTRYLTSLGMSDDEVKEWMKARKKGRSFMTDRKDTLGEHLDRILERNAEIIYTADTILYNTILSNLFLATSKQRII
jgi:DUF438 domain-containing protein